MPARRSMMPFLLQEGMIEGGEDSSFGSLRPFGERDVDPDMDFSGAPPDIPIEIGGPDDPRFTGSTDRSRELNQGTPAMPVPGEQQFQIPQGVTASPIGSASITPASPLAPSPVSAQPGSPMSMGTGASEEGPRRVSPLISSALFPESRGGSALGSAGGLLGGGLGVPGGAQRGGTPNPTEQMLALLRALTQGA